MLKGKAKRDESSRTVWAEYKDGFEVEIRYQPKPKLVALAERCKKRDWDPVTRQPRETIDHEKFWEAMAHWIIVNWRGLTPDVLRKMMDMDEYPESEVPYSVEDAIELLANAYDFDSWVQRISLDLECFEAARRADQTKN